MKKHHNFQPGIGLSRRGDQAKHEPAYGRRTGSDRAAYLNTSQGIATYN